MLGGPLPGRYFLDQVAGWILELDRGKGIPFEGNYSAWLEAKNKRLSSESKSQVSFTSCTQHLCSVISRVL
jgi:energy-dependent translational throttle protein EttA